MFKNFSRYLLVVALSTFLAVFFTIVEKSYSRSLEVQNKIFEGSFTPVKPLDTSLDANFLNTLIQATNYDNSQIDNLSSNSGVPVEP